jgi:hypothetical protein
MHWDQIIKGWTQLIAKAASPQSKAREIGSQPDNSIRATVSGGDWHEVRTAPYTPDNRGERSDSSLHLSC